MSSINKQKQLRTEGHRLERFGKGVANHWRISIMLLLAGSDELTLEQITEQLDGEIHNMSQHTLRLVTAGLVHKRNKNRFVLHTLSPYGKELVKVFQKF